MASLSPSSSSSSSSLTDTRRLPPSGINTTNNAAVPSTPRTKTTNNVSVTTPTPSTNVPAVTNRLIDTSSTGGWWSRVRNSVLPSSSSTTSSVNTDITSSTAPLATPNRSLLQALNRGFFTPSGSTDTNNANNTVPTASTAPTTTRNEPLTQFEKRLLLAQQQYQQQHQRQQHMAPSSNQHPSTNISNASTVMSNTLSGSNPSSTFIVYSTPNGIRTNYTTTVASPPLPSVSSIMFASTGNNKGTSSPLPNDPNASSSVSYASRLPNGFVNEVIRQQEELNNSLKEQLRKLTIKSELEEQIETNRRVLQHLENHLLSSSSSNGNDHPLVSDIPSTPGPTTLPPNASLSTFNLSSPLPSIAPFSLPSSVSVATDTATPASQARIPPHARWKSAVSTVQNPNNRTTPLPSRSTGSSSSSSFAQIVALTKQQQQNTATNAIDDTQGTSALTAAEVVRKLMAQKNHSMFSLSSLPVNEDKGLGTSTDNTTNNEQENRVPPMMTMEGNSSVTNTHTSSKIPPSPSLAVVSSSSTHPLSSATAITLPTNTPVTVHRLPPEAKKGRLPVPLTSTTIVSST